MNLFYRRVLDIQQLSTNIGVQTMVLFNPIVNIITDFAIDTWQLIGYVEIENVFGY